MKRKVIVGIGIILLTLYLGYSSIIDSLTYYRGVDEVSKNMDYYSNHRVKMMGDIVNNSMNITGGIYSFDMGFNGTVMRVIYGGTLPSSFSNDGRVVVIGTVDNGIFRASEMNVKCPTKYEPT